MNILPSGSWEVFQEWSPNGVRIPVDILDKILLILKEEQFRKEQLSKISSEILMDRTAIRYGYRSDFPDSDPFFEFPSIYFIGGLPLQPWGLMWRGNIGMRIDINRPSCPSRTSQTQHQFSLLEGLPKFERGDTPMSLMTIRQARKEELREFAYVKDLRQQEQAMIEGKCI
jgi:hypothetical protein